MSVRRKQAPASPEFLAKIPRDFARDHLLLSGGTEHGAENLWIAERTPPDVVWNVGIRLGRPVQTRTMEDEELAARIDQAYTAAYESAELPDRETSGLDEEELLKALSAPATDLLSTSGKAPLVKFLDGLLFEALRRGASDVHLQSLADRSLLRLRVDGALHTLREIPPDVARELVGRIKVLARLDIAEKRLPQDGRTQVALGSREVDIRVSTYPTHHGERVVMRLLDKSSQVFELGKLGMPAAVEDPFVQAARRSNGLILVTGPTGSGKTTTLYSTLRRIASPELNLMTIEDPIEYELSSLGLAISQSQVHTRKGITFESGLRHILRQDPDVVLVGEIRDLETARMAMQSSLTGHLVFSTLHTNDSVSAISRLVDIGLEPHLLGASVTCVLAQRLLRRKHAACDGEGCELCFGSGLKGRTGIYELLIVDEELSGAISAGLPKSELWSLARTKGLRTLRESGEELVKNGITTLAEVERVCQVVG